ncbi:ABC transporter permease [Bordetella genomosp. 13]|uniref:ABC transporter permease n=1 Tax=Bordetella genomosp. 13 TaxID=463040 RepID=A0A1W6Z9J1_9BORD|nr:ABC transporter permease [Bordetella genomosp. 13]ARP94066.1 ABC transporter permease [Bordetella genomosp. 13]
MSNQNKRRNRLLAFLIIVLPMVLAFIYFTLLAVDRYASTAQIVVITADAASAGQQAPGAAVLAPSARTVARQETIFLLEYMASPDMLAVLQEKIKWHEHFAAQWSDPIYWVAQKISREDLLEYFQRLVTVHVDEFTGLLTVEVQGLSPEFANRTLTLMLQQSEQFINDISRKLARDQVRFAEEELVKARVAYEDKRSELIDFQSKNRLLDAEASAKAQAGIIVSLETSLATERANLKGLVSTLNADSPQVRQQRNKVTALERQLAAEKATLVSSSQEGHLNVVAAAYRKLSVDAEVAEEAYKLSVTALQNAKIEANKKVHSLVTVIQPNMPEDPTYPYKLYDLFTLLVVLVFIYGITRFIIASIEDHRD